VPSRIAFSTLAFPDATLAAAVSAGRRWGYSGVELRLIDGELIDPAMMLGLLAAGGYPHWISVEWEKRWHPEIEEPEVALPQHLDLLTRWLGSG
jgi:hypothetical protein